MSEPTNISRWAQYKTEHATTLRVAKWSSLSLVVAAALLGVGAIAMRYGGHYQLNAAGFKQLGQNMGTLGPKMTRWWNAGRYSGGAMMATVIGTAAGGVALMVLPPKIKKWREERRERSASAIKTSEHATAVGAKKASQGSTDVTAKSDRSPTWIATMPLQGRDLVCAMDVQTGAYDEFFIPRGIID